MVMKLWLASIVVFNRNNQTFNILMVNMKALIMLIISGYTQAMIDPIANRMNHLNEAFVLLFTYHLY